MIPDTEHPLYSLLESHHAAVGAAQRFVGALVAAAAIAFAAFCLAGCASPAGAPGFLAEWRPKICVELPALGRLLPGEAAPAAAK